MREFEYQDYLKEGRKKVKLSFQSEERIKRVATIDGMIQYDGLRGHYFNTGRQLLWIAESMKERRIYEITNHR